jgi:sec-independent protein translocase protein TatA
MSIMLSNTPNLLLSMPGGSEWLIIAIVIILLFGARKIPDLARGLGKGMKEFKDARDGLKNDTEQDIRKEEDGVSDRKG